MPKHDRSIEELQKEIQDKKRKLQEELEDREIWLTGAEDLIQRIDDHDWFTDNEKTIMLDIIKAACNRNC
jgi:hypothetical protein